MAALSFPFRSISPLPRPLLPSLPSLLRINANVLAPTPTRARAPIIRKAAGEAGKCSPLPPSFSLSLSLSGSVELSLDVWMGYLSHRQATRGPGEIGSSCSVSFLQARPAVQWTTFEARAPPLLHRCVLLSRPPTLGLPSRHSWVKSLICIFSVGAPPQPPAMTKVEYVPLDVSEIKRLINVHIWNLCRALRELRR